MKKIDEIFEGLDGLDSKSTNFLSRAIFGNNLPGFDYLEFKQSVFSLRKMALDKETAYKSAFATANTMGLTKTKLVQTAQHYKKVLDKEKEQFESALEKQVAQKVAAKKEMKSKLTDKIQEYRSKIKELETKVLEFQEKIDGADAEIAAAESKIKDAQQNFETAYDAFDQSIAEDITYITNTL